MENKNTIQSIFDTIQNKIGRELRVNISGIETSVNDDRNSQSLTIKVLSIIGGILSSLAFCLFLTLGSIDKSQTAMYILSGIFFMTSIWMNKKYDKVILDTISVCLYLIGYVAFGIGFYLGKGDPLYVQLLYMLFATITLLISKSYILTFISILMINGACIAIFFEIENIDLVHALVVVIAFICIYFTFNEAKFMKIKAIGGKRYLAIRTGLTLSLLTCLYFVGRSTYMDRNWIFNWVSSGFLILMVMWLINCLLNRFHCEDIGKKILVFIVVLVCLGFTAMTPAISGSLLLLLLSFKVNYKTGIALGIIGFIYFIGMFYYDLNISLLHKSIAMFVSGAFFILLYLMIFKKSNSHEKA